VTVPIWFLCVSCAVMFALGLWQGMADERDAQKRKQKPPTSAKCSCGFVAESPDDDDAEVIAAAISAHVLRAHPSLAKVAGVREAEKK
jgi:hypothetical protein